MRALFFFLSFAILLIVLPQVAVADDWADCELSAPHARIAACTRIIKKGGYSGRDLATAYLHRAQAHKRPFGKDKAITD